MEINKERECEIDQSGIQVFMAFAACSYITNLRKEMGLLARGGAPSGNECGTSKRSTGAACSPQVLDVCLHVRRVCVNINVYIYIYT